MIDCYKILIIVKLWDHGPSASFCSEKVNLDWRPLLKILQPNNHFEFIPRSSQSLQLVCISGVTLWRVNIFARPPKLKEIGLNFKAHRTSYRRARRFFRKMKEHKMLVLGPGIFIPLYGITFVITNLLGKFLFLICLPPRNIPDPNMLWTTN